MPSLRARTNSSEGKGTAGLYDGEVRARKGFGLAGGGSGNEDGVAATWLLVFIPGTVALLAAILFLSALAEQRFLSPRSVILGAVRARRSTPEHAEALVAREFDRLLRRQEP